MTKITRTGQISRRLSHKSLVALTSPDAEAVMNRLADLEVIEAATIERCAQVAETEGEWAGPKQVAAAIRALKDKP